MTALQAGVMAYKQEALVPIEELGWDNYDYRLFRYYHYDSYVNNTVYSRLVNYAAVHKEREKLYKHTRSIYNPASRLEDLLVSYVYGGAIDMQTLEQGAIPIVAENPALLDAIKQVFTWSRWGEQKSLYVRRGARYGDSFLKVCDDPSKRKVYLESLHPGKVREWTTDNVGNIQSIVIEYLREEDPDIAALTPSRFGLIPQPQSQKQYLYTEKITKLDDGSEKWETFKDGEPFGYYANEFGILVPSWTTEYGFIPVTLTQYKNIGLFSGANAFYSSLRKIDEINDNASLLNDQVRKAINPMWYFAGVRRTEEVNATTNGTEGTENERRKDAVPAIYGPAGSQPFPMVFDLPIDQAYQNLQGMIAELERDMPELALQRIREGGSDMTEPGNTSGYSDAIGRVEEARGNYDAGQIRALQMAITIGGIHQYDGFEGFNLDSYAAGDLKFYIRERPVIADQLSKRERITQLQMAGTAPLPIQKLILKEMEYDTKTIEDVIKEQEIEKEKNMRNAARGFGQAIFGEGDTDEDETDEEDTKANAPEPESVAA